MDYGPLTVSYLIWWEELKSLVPEFRKLILLQPLGLMLQQVHMGTCGKEINSVT
jgi:hypothetical protein